MMIVRVIIETAKGPAVYTINPAGSFYWNNILGMQIKGVSVYFVEDDDGKTATSKG